VRGRVLPSGRPTERVVTLVQSDPTWQLEHSHFLGLVADRHPGNLKASRDISRIFEDLDTQLAAQR